MLEAKPSQLALLFASLVITAIAWIVVDYKRWIDFGQGAPPNSCHPYGYAVYQVQKYYLLWIKRANVHDTAPLRAERDKQSFLAQFVDNISRKNIDKSAQLPLAVRTCDRPKMVHWILPHRVAPPYNTSDVLSTTLHSLLADVVLDWQTYCGASSSIECQKLANVPRIGLSRLEGLGNSILLTPNEAGIDPCDASSTMFSEVAHIHMQDMSFHVVLSPADAAVVVDCKYGERFAVSGRKMWTGRLRGRVVPAGYVLLYPPRNKEEIQTVKQIVMAGIAYALYEHVK